MVSGLGQTRALPTIRREMDSRAMRVNGEIGTGAKAALGEETKQRLRVAGGNHTVPLETNTISY